MKKITFITTLLFTLFAIHLGFSQKAVVIGTNNVTPDGFTFLAAENLLVGEIIYFTENEYNDAGNAFVGIDESIVAFTVTSNITIGDVVFVKEISTNTFAVTLSGTGSGNAVKTGASGSFALATDGEPLYAYSDSDDNPLNGVTEIYSVLYTGSGEIPVVNGGLIPINQNPVADFPNAIVVHGFPALQPNRTEFNFSPVSTRDAVSKAALENTSNYLHAQTNTDLSIVQFTNLNLAGANPSLTLAASPTSVIENSGTDIVFTFTLSANATSDTTVNFSVSGDTNSTDYTQTGAATFTTTAGTVVITSGSNIATVTLTPTGDTFFEPDETIVLTATTGTGYDAGSPSSASGTIVNDDTTTVTPLVAITGLNHTTSDGFSFTALNTISAGTVIYFTENSFNNTTLTFSGTESVFSWTAPVGGIAQGEVIVVKETAINTFALSCNGDCGTINLESGDFSTASNGESFYAYIDMDNDHTNGIASINSVLYTGNSTTPGGNIPSIEDPSTKYIGAIVVDGFAATPADRTEYNPTLRNVTVDQANFQNTTNWLLGMANQDLSTTPFSNIIITTGSPNPSATVAISPSNINEDSSTAMVYTFTLDAPASGDVTLNFTVGGTATFTSDYTVSGSASFTATTGSITILDGTTNAAISITPVTDTTVEILETIELIIASGTGYDGGTPNSAIGSISNDDTLESNPLVAITGLNHVSPDGFSFVAAKDIPAGTVVYFTENSFNNTTLLFDTSEAVLSWTAPGTGTPKGDVIVITETAPDVFLLTCNGTSGVACGSVTLESGNLSTATDGETFYAYEDTDNDLTNGVTDIYAVLFTGSAGLPGGSIPPSENPSGIYLSALVVDGFSATQPNRTEYDAANRNVLVTDVVFENISNWAHAQPNPPDLSPIPFTLLDIVDTTPPVAACKNITVQLDPAGTITIAGIDVDNGSTDNIGIVSYNVDIDTFTCVDIGTNNITLTVSDAAGNTATCAAVVTVEDSVLPTLTSVSNRNENVDVNCNFTIPDYTSLTTATDNCGAATVTQSPSIGTVINGHGTVQTITLTADDGHSNTNFTTFDVTLVDTTLPALTTVTNRDEDLDANCNFTIPNYTSLTTATDNCGVATVTQSPSIGTVISGHGTVQTLTLTANDGNGNTNSITFDVTLIDGIIPALTSVENRNENLDANCNFTIPDYTSLTTATDNCGTATLTQSPSIGTVISGHDTAQTITLTANDGNGNIGTTTFEVTLIDSIAPIITCVEDIVTTNNLGICGAAVDFEIPNTITFSAAFINGQSSTNCGAWQTFQSELLSTLPYTKLTIKGSLEPIGVSVTDPAKVLQLANALRTGSPTSITDGGRTWRVGNCGTDQFGNPAIELSAAGSICSCPNNEYIVRPCIDVLSNNPNWGGAGTATCSGPSQTLTVEFEMSGNGGGIVATDECDSEPTITQTAGLPSGSIFPVGTTINTFVATDLAGNTSTCSFDVTVTDTEAPIVNTQDVTVQLDEDGEVSITPTQIDNVSIDNCEIDTYTLDITAFTCENVGENTVTLTVTDVNGNSNTATAVVTVEDSVAPAVVTVAPFTLQLDEEGSTLYIDVEDIENGSTDACGIDSYALDVYSFDCSNVGENTVTLSVTDINGNTGTATTVVTIEDNVAPIVITQNVTVELNSRGEAFIDTDDIDNGSFDNCEVASMSLDITAFECSLLGDYTVVLTVVDASGNSTSEPATVTVTAGDIDGDLIADYCDDDMDGDDVYNEDDNCVRTYNPDQRDIDFNGIGDVCDDSALFFPQGFSPNGDGVRDTFIITGLAQHYDNEFEVFNRWGNKVYSNLYYENNWDGISNGNNVLNKNEKLPAGPYFYVLKVGYDKVYKGWIYINY